MQTALIPPVRQRANGRCEYCRVPQQADAAAFEIDHIIARKHIGPSVASNLCLQRCTHALHTVRPEPTLH
jgi:hypothetical protein